MEHCNINDVISSHINYDVDDNEDENIEQDFDKHQTQNHREWSILCDLATRGMLMYYVKYIYKEPCYTSFRTGNIFIQEILNGHETRCYRDFRLNKSVFLELCKDLVDNYGLQDTRGMSIYEQVGMFLMVCGHGCGNRLVQEVFQHSGETIHRHFHSVLNAVCKLGRDIVKPHARYNQGEGHHEPQNPRYLPFFKVCITYKIHLIINY